MDGNKMIILDETPQSNNNAAGHGEGNSSGSGSRRMSNPTQTLANFANNKYFNNFI
jgi:hypothetical protein